MSRWPDPAAAPNGVPPQEAAADAGSVLDARAVTGAFWNELHDAAGRLRPAWQRFVAAVPEMAATPESRSELDAA